MPSKVLALQNSIKQQINLLADFIALLQRENTALSENPADQDLIEITAKKNDFAKRIADIDQQRITALNSLGFADDAAGVNKLITTTPELKPLFDNLWALADQAQNINIQNGQLLNTYIDHNQKAIDTLRSLMSQDLYDASGKFRKK